MFTHAWLSAHISQAVWAAFITDACSVMVLAIVLMACLKARYPDIYAAIARPRASERELSLLRRLGGGQLPSEVSALMRLCLVFLYTGVLLTAVEIMLAMLVALRYAKG